MINMVDQHQKLKRSMIAGIGASVLILASSLSRWPLNVADTILVIVGGCSAGYWLRTLQLLGRGELVIRAPTPAEAERAMRSKAVVMLIVVVVVAVCLINTGGQ